MSDREKLAAIVDALFTDNDLRGLGMFATMGSPAELREWLRERIAPKVAALLAPVSPGAPPEPGHDAVTRIEVIDHRSGAGPRGRVLSAWDATVELSYQDEGRTLKIFVADRVRSSGAPEGAAE